MSRITKKSLYYKQRYRKFVFSIPREDLPRVIAWLEDQTNRTDYLTRLVTDDMLRKGVEPDEAILAVPDRTVDK